MDHNQIMLDRIQHARIAASREYDRITLEVVPDLISSNDWRRNRRQLRQAINLYLRATLRVARHAHAHKFRSIAASGNWWETSQLAMEVAGDYGCMAILWIAAATFMQRLHNPATMLSKFGANCPSP